MTPKTKKVLIILGSATLVGIGVGAYFILRKGADASTDTSDTTKKGNPLSGRPGAKKL